MSSVTVMFIHSLLLHLPKVMLVVMAAWSSGVADTAVEFLMLYIFASELVQEFLPVTASLRSNSKSTGQFSFMDLRITHALNVTSSSTLTDALSRPYVTSDRDQIPFACLLAKRFISLT